MNIYLIYNSINSFLKRIYYLTKVEKLNHVDNFEKEIVILDSTENDFIIIDRNNTNNNLPPFSY